MKKIGILFLVFCLILVVAVVVDMHEIEKTQFVLNTVSSIKVNGYKEDVVDRAFERVFEVEKHMSSHTATSDLASGTLNLDTSYVIHKGLGYGRISGGLFDISIKPVTELWDINGDNPKVPSQQEIEKALALVDYKKVSISDGMLVMSQGMAIELGAVAKGYAADEAERILREGGVKDGIVDLGGNIVALGTKTVGVRNPLSENNGDYFGILKITDCAVATSGGYERYFEKDGKRYHHIFDPSTGYPVQTDVLSASVICEKAIDADCWSTILFSAGVEGAKEYINKYDLKAILVDTQNNVYVFGNIDFEIEPHSGFNVIR